MGQREGGRGRSGGGFEVVQVHVGAQTLYHYYGRIRNADSAEGRGWNELRLRSSKGGRKDDGKAEAQVPNRSALVAELPSRSNPVGTRPGPRSTRISCHTRN